MGTVRPEIALLYVYVQEESGIEAWGVGESLKRDS